MIIRYGWMNVVEGREFWQTKSNWQGDITKVGELCQCFLGNLWRLKIKFKFSYMLFLIVSQWNQ